MNLRITSKAKNNQISFLITLDNFITKRHYTKASLVMKRLNKYLVTKNPNFNIRIKEGAHNKVEMYADKNLIGYYA